MLLETDNEQLDSGLWLTGKAQDDTEKIKRVIATTDYHGTYYDVLGCFFFPEQQELYDILEGDLTAVFKKYGIIAKFEAA